MVVHLLVLKFSMPCPVHGMCGGRMISCMAVQQKSLVVVVLGDYLVCTIFYHQVKSRSKALNTTNCASEFCILSYERLTVDLRLHL